ncbi:MAG TPA: YbhB/YbcL family Raf kinase inhibitor-like protein [Acidimicrobiales bacterium]
MLSRSPRPLAGLVGVALAATVMLGACDHGDGRELRPAGPDQTATLVNSTTTSVPADPAVLGSGLPGEGVGEAGMTLRAPWEDEGIIDARYTCQNPSGTPAGGTSPALSWSGVPAEATNLALVVTDLSTNGFVHWIAVGLDPKITGIEEGAIPAGAVQGKNGFGSIGWTGPCPPAGTGEHEYLIQLYALDQDLGLEEGFAADPAIVSIEDSSIGTVSLVGRYGASGATNTTIGPTVTAGPSPT